MASQLEHSAILRIGGAISGSFRAAVGGVSGATSRLQGQIRGLRDQQRGMTVSLREAEAAARHFGVEGSAEVAALEGKHRALESRLQAVVAELHRAEREAVRLGERGSDEVDRLRHESQRLEREQRQVAKELRVVRREAERLGVEGSHDVAKLRSEHERFGRVLDREQHKLERLQKLADLNVGARVRSSVGQLGRNLSSATSSAVKTAAVVGGAGATALGWFAKSALDAAAGIESMETALVTSEGSQEGARKSMDWIVDFADRTPYNLDQVGEAFVRLRSFQIDPTSDSLRILGDTASSMGKDVMMAVEAMTDAVAGETERLKEFGIRSKTQGDQLTFFFKNKLGEQVRKTVDKNNQDMIRSTLLAIWNDKYGGSMQRASRTWTGLMSTLESKWQLFQVRVMNAGVFDRLKGELQKLLANIDTWAKDGTLDRWAKEIATVYGDALTSIGEGFATVRKNWPEIKTTLRELWEVAKVAGPALFEVARTLISLARWAIHAAGGADNLVYGLAALGAAKTLAPIGSLVSTGWDVVSWLRGAKAGADALAPAIGGVVPQLGRLAPMLTTLRGLLGPTGVWAAGIAGAAAFGVALGSVIDRLAGWLGDMRGGKLSTELGLSAAESDWFNGLAESVGSTIGWEELAQAARANRKRNAAEHDLRSEPLNAQTFARARGIALGAGNAPKAVTIDWGPLADAARTRQEQGATNDAIQNAAKQGTMSTTVHDNRLIHIKVDGAQGDPDEIARKVSERLKRDMRREALASHG